MPILFVIAFTIATSWLAIHSVEGSPVVLVDDGVQYFEKHIRPLFAQQCHSCHGPQKQKGGLRLDSPETIKKGGDSGAIVQAGNPVGSLLHKAVSYQEELKMPPRGKLTAEEIDHIKRWIELGGSLPTNTQAAPANANPVNTFDLAKRKKHWCYQPLKSVNVPRSPEDNWSFNHVDKFIRAKLFEKGLKPARDTDKRGWLRRVTFDLTGLPPTVQEIDSFDKDQSPEASSKVVDRLLASPAYGVRWGRHWLDLMRYADTLGHEFDFDLPNAWRYRNYVIRALNDDVPYHQLVLEHLAGDLLPAPRLNRKENWNESIQATAFLWLGEAKQAPVDVRQEQADRIDNQIDVIGKAFLGQTIACARCHDHKFDAIATRDYYALYGVLKSSRYQQAIIDDPVVNQAAIAGLSQVQQKLHQRTTEHSDVVKIWKDLEQLGIPGATDKPVTDLPLSTAIPHGTAWQQSPGATVAMYHHHKTKQPTLRYVPARAWDSGLYSTMLEGSLRTPTLTLDKRYLHVHAAGWGSRIRVIVDGFVVIRDPIYGGLRKVINENDPKWYIFDLQMWPGRQVYVEFLDGGPADPSLTQDHAPGKDAWLQVRRIITSDDHRPPQNERATQLELQLLGQLNKPDAVWREFIVEQQKYEKQLRPARYALATAEGNGDDERVFIRGNHRNLGEAVPRGLSNLYCGAGPLSAGASSGRLALAQRLIDPEKNPLIARVIVNRIWKHHFGQGLVRSVDDFGHMGEVPSHPELLDYLARWFVDSGWSMKKLHREIVLSHTYLQMNTNNDPAVNKIDPQNRMLSRMPLRRLEAEAIRDAMLSISGQIKPEQVEEGVMPYLTSYMQGRGRPSVSGPVDGAGRRSIFLSVRRNFLPPILTSFDFPTPFTAIGKRSVSNIPAQSLTMMNDPLVKELAQKWASLMSKKYPDRDERVHAMVLMAFSHDPSPELKQTLMEFVSGKDDKGQSGVESQAWAELAHALFCSKEFVFVP